MLWLGLEPAIPVIEWAQTYALDRSATGIGRLIQITDIFQSLNTSMENFFKSRLRYAMLKSEQVSGPISSNVFYFSKPRIFPDLRIEKVTVRRDYTNYKAYR
jgi:hypothetical protein